MAQRLRISRGGQVSVPARVRKRWRTSVVLAEDHGDRLVLRPGPDDPIEAAAGAFADPDGPPLDVIASRYKEEELEAEERKWRGHFGGSS